MRRLKLALPGIGVLAMRRGMLGTGARLVLAKRIRKRRKGLGWTLLSIGIVAVPILRKLTKR